MVYQGGVRLMARIEKRWTPKVLALESGNIAIIACLDGVDKNEESELVRPPHWLERQYDYSFENKVSAAYSRIKKHCDKLNGTFELASEIAALYSPAEPEISAIDKIIAELDEMKPSYTNRLEKYIADSMGMLASDKCEDAFQLLKKASKLIERVKKVGDQ
jgi:hypothetical protein